MTESAPTWPGVAGHLDGDLGRRAADASDDRHAAVRLLDDRLDDGLPLGLGQGEELAGVDRRDDAAGARRDAELDAAPERRDVEVAVWRERGHRDREDPAKRLGATHTDAFIGLPLSVARGRGAGVGDSPHSRCCRSFVLVELDAEAGAVGHAEDTAFGAERARQQVVADRVRRAGELEDQEVGRGRREVGRRRDVDRGAHADVGGPADVVEVRHRGDLAALGDAAGPADVRQDQVDGLLTQPLLELPARALGLAGRDRHLQRR